MSDSEGTAVLVGLFALRCILPLAITLAFGFLMNRLVDRWNAEEAEGLEDSPEVVPEGAQPSTGIKLPTLNIPCWVFNNCEESKRDDCAAYKHPTIPCFLARLRSEGKMPSGCPDCERYIPAMVTAR